MAARNALTLFFAALLGCSVPPLPAAEGKIVSLHYTLKSAEFFIDSTETKGAVTVRLGEGDGLLKGMRKGIVGMKAGEERAFNIAPEDGFAEGEWADRVLQARVKVVSVREPRP